MKKTWIALLSILAVVLVLVMSFAGFYNTLVKMDEGVTQAWAQVENVYQRRLDLIPNLVETVKGYAAHEQSTFIEVTEARGKAAGAATPDAVNSPQKFAEFEASQAALSSALGRLLVVVERYPDLKANENFLSLQAQLEGTENRITVERGRYNEAARALNTALRQFPGNIIGALFGFRSKTYFQSQTGAQNAPQVRF
ncbi:MAG: LemA family protein [Candidatus Omnitrophica bacterium]|nr:LemA family protein [Candidatus Omnitrophota bacterium]